MMSLKKMLVFGAAASVTVSLIGCKDDNDDACDYGSTPTIEQLQDCNECYADKASGCNVNDPDCFRKAFEDCGGKGDIPDLDDFGDIADCNAACLQCVNQRTLEYVTNNGGTQPTPDDVTAIQTECQNQ